MGSIQNSVNQLLASSALLSHLTVDKFTGYAKAKEAARHAGQDTSIDTGIKMLNDLDLPRKPETETGKGLVADRNDYLKLLENEKYLIKAGRLSAIQDNPGDSLSAIKKRAEAEKEYTLGAKNLLGSAYDFMKKATNQLTNKEKFFRLYLRSKDNKYAGSTKYMSEKEARTNLGDEAVDTLIKAGKYKEKL